MTFKYLRGDKILMNYHEYIVRDSKICGGEPVIKNTRVTVRTLLASLAEGATTEEIIKDYPTVDEMSVRAVIVFAALSAKEDIPLPIIPVLS
jgi:uncharacterized protein (DUF433 family)